MKGYLDIKESALLVDRHERTIRRVIIQKRENINKKEGYEVVKHTNKKYYISTDYLHKRYNIPTQQRQYTQPLKEDTEELRELKETVKMYAIMLEEKDKQIIRLKEENNYFKSQNEKMTNSIITTLDQSQKLSALEKQLDILKIEK
jgi:hypothetical protein